MGRSNIHLDIRRHLPEIFAFEEHSHAVGHELLVPLPVMHGDFGADRDRALRVLLRTLRRSAVVPEST
jgi:hypothetical protein